MIETLAALAHDQWSGWMKYLFEKSTLNEDGTVTIPKWAVDRWQRQMDMSYNELGEEEKDSDRAEAERVLAVVARWHQHEAISNKLIEGEKKKVEGKETQSREAAVDYLKAIRAGRKPATKTEPFKWKPRGIAGKIETVKEKPND